MKNQFKNYINNIYLCVIIFVDFNKLQVCKNMKNKCQIVKKLHNFMIPMIYLIYLTQKLKHSILV